MNIIKHLNYKDLLIILGLWFFMAFFGFLTGEVSFKYSIFNDFFHFLCIVAGRFIYLALITFYLTSLYQINFNQLGFKFNGLFKQVIFIFSLIVSLLIPVLFFINIPLSFNNITGTFSPLYKINSPEEFVKSLFPFIILLPTNLIISMSEMLLLSKIILQLFSVVFNQFFTLLLTSLFYSILLLSFNPSRILINFIIGFIALFIYRRVNSLIIPSLFIAGYYTIYILYVYGWHFIRF